MVYSDLLFIDNEKGKIRKDMKKQVIQMIAEIVKTLGVFGAEIQVEFPESVLHGEFTTNVAMILSKRLSKPPREIAQQIVDKLKVYQNTSEGTWIARVEIAGPGFINISVTDACFGSVISTVLQQKEGFGMATNGDMGQETRDKSGQLGQAQVDKNISKTIDREKAPKNVDKKGKTIPSIVDSAGKEDESGQIALRGEKTQEIWDMKQETSDKRQETGNRKQETSDRRQEVGGVSHVSCPVPRTIMVEFAHPNTHKAFHIGHLRNITTGETIVRLLESQGNRVIRANYQGDVGMHIAKALYALLEVSPYKDDVDNIVGVKERTEFLGKAYAAGSKAFEDPSPDGEKAKGIIKDLNSLIYASAQRYAREVGRNPGSTDYLKLVVNHVHPLERVYALWKETRQWSLDYFETIYARVHTTYDRKFFESECLSGVDTAKDAVKKKILEESDGAIIFRGEPYGLETRVFVNSLGLPTYEAKELALAPMEASEFGLPDKIIHCVGPEQTSFFKVTFKAEELLGLVPANVQYHLAYGWVKLKEGKMSSRTGNVILGEWLIDEVKKAIQIIIDSNTSKQNDTLPEKVEPFTEEKDEDIAETLAIAAIKYAFLKVSTNQEIAFDLKESINTNGDSGPYLIYTYARARSVLRKASELQSVYNGVKASEHQSVESGIKASKLQSVSDDASTPRRNDASYNSDEHLVARLISQFPDVVKASADNYAPNTLCTYLFQLAQAFNSFYGKNPILEKASERQSAENGIKASELQSVSDDASTLRRHDATTQRLALTSATAQVIKNGLHLLGIKTLERM